MAISFLASLFLTILTMPSPTNIPTIPSITVITMPDLFRIIIPRPPSIAVNIPIIKHPSIVTTSLCIKAVLEAADMNFENIVKTSIFISDMHNFGAINEVYGSYFNEETAPARETVEVANLPKFVNVEVSAIAIK